MSAIYGYTLFRDSGEAYGEALKKQNLRYGSDSVDAVICKATSDSGETERTSLLGCCTGILSDQRAGGPDVIAYGKYRAVFDALLYNRDELEPRLDGNDTYLKDYNRELSQLSDGELLFFYVHKFGFDALKEVNGDFAGAVYDTEDRTWTLVRDHSGIRPLFYYLDREKFIFSTDIRGIIAFPGIKLSVNETNLYNITMGYNELTLCETDYSEIHCIRPAAWTVINAELVKTENIYWHLGSGKVHYDEPAEYAEKLKRLVYDSVGRRLGAVSGKVGCELSGGLDSSVIAILISRSGRDCSYFSWSLSQEDLPLREGEDERRVIADICRQEGITCAFARKRRDDEFETVSQRLGHFSVPYMNTEYLSEGSRKVRKDGARVMFTGHGGDEGVSHRANFYELWYHKERLAYFRALWNSTSVKDKRILRFIYRVGNQMLNINPALRDRYRNVCNLEYYLTDDFKQKMKNTEHLPLPFAYDPVSYIMQGGQRVRIDNAAVQGAENGIQYIFPYLDYRVLDYVVSIPRYCFQNGFTNRAVFREAFADIMPESLRAVHYKDEASRRNAEPTPEEIAEAAIAVKEVYKEIIEYLDRGLWGKYFDFGRLEHFLPEMEKNADAVRWASRNIEVLYRCADIQNLNERLQTENNL